MLHKLALALLSIAVLCYAIYLIARKKPLPEPLPEKGLRRRFFLATAVCMTMLGASTTGCKTTMMCYDQMLPNEPEIPAKPRPWRHLSPREVRGMFRWIWLSLDYRRIAQFGELVEEAVDRAELDEVTGKTLVLTYKNRVAYKIEQEHNANGGRGMSCYAFVLADSPRGIAGEPIAPQAERLQKRIEQLKAAKANSDLSPTVLEMIQTDIARELIAIRLKSQITENSYENYVETSGKPDAEDRQFVERALGEASESPPDLAAKEAARIIVEMETQDDFDFKT